ncbi:hypothetical protein RCL1_007472 [Eukaryota sp. TZLM3-RCL]
MGCCFSKAPKDIVVCGNSNAGKTTLIRRLVHPNNDFPVLESAPTIGIHSESTSIQNVSFNLLDMSGAKPFRFHWRQYFPNASIIVFVIDASDYDNLQESLGILREHVLQVESSKSRPLLILANKNDIKGSLSADQISRHLSQMVSSSSLEREYLIVSSSGKTGNGLSDIIKFMLKHP